MGYLYFADEAQQVEYLYVLERGDKIAHFREHETKAHQNTDILQSYNEFIDIYEITDISNNITTGERFLSWSVYGETIVGMDEGQCAALSLLLDTDKSIEGLHDELARYVDRDTTEELLMKILRLDLFWDGKYSHPE